MQSKDTIESEAPSEGVRAFVARNAIVLTALLLGAWLLLGGLVSGNWRRLGEDSDDMMRWVQVQDLIDGQSWFDLMQYRLGLDGDTLMHWSRLPDIPLFILYHVFDLVLPSDQAMNATVWLWPPLLAVCVVLVIGWAGKNLSTRYEAPPAFVPVLLFLTFVMMMSHYRFTPGALDHHNLQYLFLLISIAGLLDPHYRARSYALAGLGAAVSVSIGMEVYLYIAVLCAVPAVLWLIKGTTVRRGVISFGLALCLGLALIFVSTIAPTHYGRVSCDNFSVMTLIAGGAGGLGMALCAALLSGKSIPVRAVALIGLGGVCLGLFLTVGPQCLSNPLDDLPVEVKAHWLDKIREAKPLIGAKDHWLSEVPFLIFPTLLAFGLSVLNIRKKQAVEASGLFAALLAVSILMTFYQVRFYTFGHMFALFPLALWTAQIYHSGKARSEGSVAYIFALAASMPVIYGLVAMPFMDDTSDEDGANLVEGASCYESAEALSAYENLPKGLILANTNAAPFILLHTPHSAITGNYHRNIAGLSASIEIMLADTDLAGELLHKYDVDYMHFCPNDSSLLDFIEDSPNGFVAQLKDGGIPSFLEEIPVPENADREKILGTAYRVVRP